MILRRFLLLIGLFFSLSLPAQDIKLCYEHIYDASQRVDTLNIYLKGNADTTLALRAANFSVAYHDSCAVFDTLESYFTGVWGSFFERIQVSNDSSLIYNNREFDARVQYGNSDPGLPMATPVFVPNSENDSLLLFKLIFKGRCSQKLFIENELDNSLNQFADEMFNTIDYDYFSCQGQDSVFFCTRQERDAVDMRDSLRIFLEGNAERSIGLSEVNFSVAFNDSCTSFDSLQSLLNAKWGEARGQIDIQDSLQLSYNGKNYDSRLIYNHHNPSSSPLNLLSPSSQIRFPTWISTLYFSGSCSQDIYMETQAEHAENLMLNQLDRLVGYGMSLCDSLPEDTIVLSMATVEMQKAGWQISPNPISDQLFIQHIDRTIFSGRMQLMDIAGKVVWEEYLTMGKEIKRKEMSNFPTGVYILNIEDKNGTSTHIRLLKK